MDDELRTSAEWQRLCTIIVLDVDGWDRKNYDYSWGKERISRSEFENRMQRSTTIGNVVNVDGSRIEMWKDRMLLNCPCCGAPAELGWYYLSCTKISEWQISCSDAVNCGIHTFESRDIDGLIATWNKRVKV